MTKDGALKLALEALRRNQNRLREYDHRQSFAEQIDENHAAITVIKQVLEQPETVGKIKQHFGVKE